MQQESQGKRSSPRKRVAGIITYLLLSKHAIVLSTPCILFIQSRFKTLKLVHQITSLPHKYATNYSYLEGFTLLQVSPPLSIMHCSASKCIVVCAIHLLTSNRTC